MRRRPRPPRTRVNDKIRCPEVRVIFREHNVVLPTWKALNKAKELGLDLVEVAPNAKPPVCRIVDYGKFKYEQAKQKKTDRPKTREKEVKLGVNIGEHDYAIKMMHAENFLASGCKVRIVLKFMGRQMAHKQFGFDLMEKVKVDLAGMSHIDLEPKLNNRNILMMLSPKPADRQKRKFRRAEGDEELKYEDAEEADDFDNDDDDDAYEDGVEDSSYDEVGEDSESESDGSESDK